jgi:hypothetical protein
MRANTILSLSKHFEEHAKFLSETKIGVAPLKKPIFDTMRSSSPGSRLFKTGLALTLLSPDPFTDTVGIPMMATGLALQRFRSSIGIKNVAEAIGANLDTLNTIPLDLAL